MEERPIRQKLFHTYRPLRGLVNRHGCHVRGGIPSILPVISLEGWSLQERDGGGSEPVGEKDIDAVDSIADCCHHNMRIPDCFLTRMSKADVE